MKSSEQIKPLSFLTSDTADIVKDVEAHAGPIVLTDDGEPKLVVMDIKSYRTQVETMAFLEILYRGKQQIAHGKYQDAESFFAEMDKEE